MKKIFAKNLASGLLLSVGAAVSLQAQENYATAWSGHKFVIINTQSPAIATTQLNFPILLRLGAADSAIFAQAKAGGADLRFTKTNNTTRLPHQIESWNATARTAAIWVLADSVVALKNNNALRLHWGNAAAADSSNGAQVFRTANRYQAVWHMNGSANENDATANAFTAAQNGTAPSTAGVVGPARTVSGGNYFRATGTASSVLNFPEGSNYTVSAWVFSPALPGHGTVVSKHDNAWALKLNAAADNWEFFEFGTELTSAGWNYVNAPTFEDVGVWRQLTGFRDSTNATLGLYVNGVRQGDGFATAGNTGARVLNTDITIGAQPTDNATVQRPFNGQIDEVRLSNTVRGPDWVQLEFENQKPASTVVRLADAIPAALAPAFSAFGANGFSVKAAGQGLLFRLAPNGLHGAVQARVSVHDMRGAAVWSRRVDARALSGAGLAWDGLGAAGNPASQGVYAVRLRLLDARGATLRTVEGRAALTR
jgi:hypothetical protein